MKVLRAESGTVIETTEHPADSLCLAIDGSEIVDTQADFCIAFSQASLEQIKDAKMVQPQPLDSLLPKFAPVQNETPIATATKQHVTLKRITSISQDRKMQCDQFRSTQQQQQLALSALLKHLSMLFPEFEKRCNACQQTLQTKFSAFSSGELNDIDLAIQELKKKKIGTDGTLFSKCGIPEEQIRKDHALIKQSKETLDMYIIGIKAFLASAVNRHKTNMTTVETKKLIHDNWESITDALKEKMDSQEHLGKEFADKYTKIIDELKNAKDDKDIYVVGMLQELNNFNYVAKMRDNDKVICDLLWRSSEKKYQFQQDYYNVVSDLLKLRARVNPFIGQLSKFVETANACEESIVDRVKLVVNLPVAFKRALEEVHRRRKFKEQLNQRVAGLNTAVKIMQENENSTRDACARELVQLVGQRGIPESIVPGLSDIVPMIEFELLPFDILLPQTSELSTGDDTEWEIVDTSPPFHHDTSTTVSTPPKSLVQSQQPITLSPMMGTSMIFDALTQNAPKVLNTVQQVFPSTQVQPTPEKKSSLDLLDEIDDGDDDDAKPETTIDNSALLQEQNALKEQIATLTQALNAEKQKNHELTQANHDLTVQTATLSQNLEVMTQTKQKLEQELQTASVKMSKYEQQSIMSSNAYNDKIREVETLKNQLSASMSNNDASDKDAKIQQLEEEVKKKETAVKSLQQIINTSVPKLELMTLFQSCVSESEKLMTQSFSKLQELDLQISSLSQQSYASFQSKNIKDLSSNAGKRIQVLLQALHVLLPILTAVCEPIGEFYHKLIQRFKNIFETLEQIGTQLTALTETSVTTSSFIPKPQPVPQPPLPLYPQMIPEPTPVPTPVKFGEKVIFHKKDASTWVAMLNITGPVVYLSPESVNILKQAKNFNQLQTVAGTVIMITNEHDNPFKLTTPYYLATVQF